MTKTKEPECICRDGAWQDSSWPDGVPKSLNNNFNWRTNSIQSIFALTPAQERTQRGVETQKRNKVLAKRAAQRNNADDKFGDFGKKAKQ